jgi:hypothetical protein
VRPPSDSIQRLLDQYRNLVMQGEKHIDPRKILQAKCRSCQRCGGRGCPDRMALLTQFEQSIRVEHFVWGYLTGLAELARERRTPDLSWLLDLAAEHGVTDILDDCLNAAAAQQVRVRLLLSRTDAHEDARDELMVRTFLWFRPRIVARLGVADDTLEGRASSGDLMALWHRTFLARLRAFPSADCPEELLVGCFLNFIGRPRPIVDRETSPPASSRSSSANVPARSVTEAVGLLPEPHRSVARMLDFEGDSAEATAARLGLTVDSVPSLHRTARRLLRDLVGTPD